jgi:hypothetical protein
MLVECKAIPAFDLRLHPTPGSLEIQDRMGYSSHLDLTGRQEAPRELGEIGRSEGARHFDLHALAIDRESPEALMGLED